MLNSRPSNNSFHSLVVDLERRHPTDDSEQEITNRPLRPRAPEIQHRVETDKYGNEVSIVRLENGRYFRMVHYSPKHHFRQKSIIYASRGKFVRVETYHSNNDCALVTIKIAGYEMAWGDGDPSTPVNNPAGPDLTATLKHIFDDNFDSVILTVLDAIQDRDDLWEHKTLARP